MAPRSPEVGLLNENPPTNGSSMGEATARPPASRRMAAPKGLPFSSRLRWGCALLALCAACSTRVTSENIAAWKTTQKGPERLHEALADHAVSPKLRAEAAVALIDIGH